MSRTLTTRNDFHPHNRLKTFLQEVREATRNLSNDQLDEMVKAKATEMKLGDASISTLVTRKHKIEFLEARAAVQYKQVWKERYGWEFDDCYDDAKLIAHVKAMADKQKAAEFPLRAEATADVPPPFDFTKIYNLAGEEMTREEFDAMPEDEQMVIRMDRAQKMEACVAAGFGGCLPENQAQLVDMRVQTHAIPLPKSGELGVPEPTPVDASAT